MDKRKVLIISIVSVILLIAAVIIILFATGAVDSFKKQFEEDSETANNTTAEYVVEESTAARPKIEAPASIVTAIYNSYNDNSQEEIKNITANGFNSIIFDFDELKADNISSLIQVSRDEKIYTGLRINGTENNLSTFVANNNVDFVIIYGLDETAEQFGNNFTALKNDLKKTDNNLKIAYEPSDISKISNSISQITDEVDFMFIKQTSDDIEAFQNAQNVWNEATTDIWMCQNLTNLNNISSNDALEIINTISSSATMSQCKALAFYYYDSISSATGAAAKSVKEYISKRETYLVDKDFSISNYSKNSFSVDTSTISFKGTSSPLYELTCNGNVIKTADNGDFSVDCILSAGNNKIVFEHKGKSYTYNVNYKIKLLKSVSPNKSVTVPGGIEVEITAVAHKDAKVTAEFNGKTYTLTKLSGENSNSDTLADSGSDFATFSTSLKTPAGKSTLQKLGNYKVTATLNGASESKNGASITVSANETKSANTQAVNVETSATTSSESSTSVTEAESSTEGGRTTRTTRILTERTRTALNGNDETTSSSSLSSSENKSNSSLQQYSYTENYGLGTAKLCLITDDYVETYSGSNTSSKSVPDCSPLLKGTVDYITGSGTCSDDSDNVTYYYLSSGVKVPLFREENTTSGSDTKITHLKVIDGYKMPSNHINILSCNNSNGNTIIKLEMNRLVAFNAKLTGQSYSSYNGRMVAVSKVDCSGLEFTFSDTSNISGSLSFSNSIIKSGSASTNGTNATIKLSFANSGKFYGYHYEYSNGILTITIKSKPSSLSGYTIMLDPGHGGYDGGASCAVSSSQWSEKKVNLSLANKIKELLESEGANVIMTRSSDSFLSLSSRTMMARNQQPDLYISIHCDSSSSSSAYGTSAYYYRAYSQPLAKYIHEAIVSAYNNSIYSGQGKSKVDRGTSFYAFKVSRIEECPAVLIEYGFVSNTIECQALQNASTREILAKATVTGIKNYISNS